MIYYEFAGFIGLLIFVVFFPFADELLVIYPESIKRDYIGLLDHNQRYGCRPLKSTRRHGPFYALATCDMGLKR